MKMKWWYYLIIAAVLAIAVFAYTNYGHAQAPPGPPTVTDLDQQLQEVGCKAERNAAAQTIVQLQKTIADLQAAIEQLPRHSHAQEALPLAGQLQQIQGGRHRRPQVLGDILPIVLARLGVGALSSRPSGVEDPT